MTIDELKREFRAEIKERAFSVLKRLSGTEVLSGIFENEGTFTEILSDRNSLSDSCAGRCNTYPFGDPTSILYPLLLAVCAGNTKLGSILKYIVKHCRDRFANSSLSSKTVVLLTTKWDNRIFKIYETELIRLSVVYDIKMVFLLVTDYGITEIPFGWFCESMLRRGIDINMNDNLDYDSDYLMPEKSVGIIRFYHDMGTWGSFMNEYFYIDFNKGVYYRGREPVSGKIDNLKPLPRVNAGRFLRDTEFVNHWKSSYMIPDILDADSWWLEYFGRRYEGRGDHPEKFKLFCDMLENLCPE